MNIKSIAVVLPFFLLFNEAALLSMTYMVTDPREEAGLFSTFHDVIGALDLYDKEKDHRSVGLIVDFEDKGLFYDAAHGPNWWNYYFEPIRLGKLNGTPYKFPSWKKSVLSFEAEFGLSPEHYHALVKNYVFLKSALQQKLDTFIKEQFEDSYVVGVHYRGTDKKGEAPVVSYESVCNRINEDLERSKHKNVKIFVATDEESFLDYARQRFPGQVISSSAIRSQDNSPVHFSKVGTPYQRGEDAVVDCWLLARCSILYKMASNLSDAAMKMNPKMPTVHFNTSYFEDRAHDTYSIVITLNTLLALLDKYEKNEVKGVRAFFPTSEGKNYKTGVNWWDYHFQPLEVGNNDDFKPMPYYQQFNMGLSNFFEMPRERASELWKKYIQLKPEITTKITDFIRKNKESPLIGVHYHKQSGLKPEEVIPYSLVLEKLDEQIEQKSLHPQLLIVTNDDLFFDMVRTKYPQAIYYYQPPAGEQNPTVRLEEEERTLIHANLLSKTNKVIGSASVVLKLASQLNAQLDVQTIDTLWLEKR